MSIAEAIKNIVKSVFQNLINNNSISFTRHADFKPHFKLKLKLLFSIVCDLFGKQFTNKYKLYKMDDTLFYDFLVYIQCFFCFYI